MRLLVILGLCLSILTACSGVNDPRLAPSASTMPLFHPDFTEYQRQVAGWLADNRISTWTSLSDEVAINAPFQCGDRTANRAALLVHGLGDSPFFMQDVARELCASGMHVRAILLQGHGSKPGDMLNSNYAVWQKQVDQHASALLNTYPEVWLGGFSTGANLVTVTATKRSVKGVMLFSPAFNSRFSAAWLAPYLAPIMPWPNNEAEDNPTRYNSVAMAGFAAYQGSVAAVNKALTADKFDKPAFIVVPQADSVVDTANVRALFDGQFSHPSSRLIWLGDGATGDDRLKVYSMALPDKRIAASSHMAPLFSPQNPLYGERAELRICDNGQSPEKEQQCLNGSRVWYGPWGWQEDGKIVARLTYNPYFSVMTDALVDFLQR